MKVDSLEALSYAMVMSVSIQASRNRRDKLLALLPTAMEQNVKTALVSQNKAKRKWKRQKYHKGLANHSFRKIIDLLDETDVAQTKSYLTPLNVKIKTKNKISLRYLFHLLVKFHDFFKWREERMGNIYETDNQRIIMGQYYYHTESLRFGAMSLSDPMVFLVMSFPI
jgi:hypothetical protein